MSHYNNIVVEQHGNVALIVLSRPMALNALSPELLAELGAALDALEKDDEVLALVLTGGLKVFAAGADVKALQHWTYSDIYQNDAFTKSWDRLSKFRKPAIAAVSGYALGGGCELAMMCDFILASESARFGQPEISLGTIPGAGGTQRLARFVGKSKAMEMVLTGRIMDAHEAERCGLVSRVLPIDDLLSESLKTAAKIAEMSRPIAMMAKEAVNCAFESTLDEGVRFERRLFHATFSTDDQKEGMRAFLEKRKPTFTHR
ncbi:enoyl-CoA hydratase [Herbaspirillum robiniae]|uniref:enoyl-CoA hydratase n=1 Tax=Herbaspirillum robiniae TaxID=2014887 RepID=UPI003D785BA7